MQDTNEMRVQLCKARGKLTKNIFQTIEKISSSVREIIVSDLPYSLQDDERIVNALLESICTTSHTSGYNGDSEYFDIDIPLFKQIHPNIQYVILCNNVYSGVSFSECICKAGYMLRDIEDSGEVFEPKR